MIRQARPYTAPQEGSDALPYGCRKDSVTATATALPCHCHCLQVYHPCILQTKKRYVGFMYESPTQAVPTFDAKGIETVSRGTGMHARTHAYAAAPFPAM